MFGQQQEKLQRQNLLFLALVLTLATSTVATLTPDEDNDVFASCEGTSIVECTDFQSEAFPFKESLKGAFSLKLKGSFASLTISPNYTRMFKIAIRSTAPLTINIGEFARSFSRLNSFEIVSSQIAALNFDGADFALNSTELVFRNSSFDDFEAIDFTPATNLSEIYFSETDLGGGVVDLSRLPTDLFTLRISENPTLTGITCDSLRRLTRLDRIVVTRTGIKNFDFGCLSPTLTHIALEQNAELELDAKFAGILRLVNLDWLMVTGTPGLSTLDVSRLPSARQVYFSDNSIERITCDDDFDRAAIRWSDVSLDDNRIVDLNLACFPASLTVIDAKRNRIARVDCDALRALAHLTFLQLEGNRLTEFDFSCLGKNVRSLYLEENRLTNIDLMPLANQTPRILFEIKGNNLKCDCKLFNDYIHLLSTYSNHVFPYCGYRNPKLCLDCDPLSPLASYQFKKSWEELVRWDDRQVGCLLQKQPVESTEEFVLMDGGVKCKRERIYNTSTVKIRCEAGFMSNHSDRANLKRVMEADSLHVIGNSSMSLIERLHNSSFRQIKVEMASLHSVNLSKFDVDGLLGLDLSGGTLVRFTTGDERDVKIRRSLRRLYLNHNAVEELTSTSSLVAYGYLQSLRLDHNRLARVDGSLLPSSIVHLRLDNNRIAVLSRFGRNLPNLRTVDLSRNMITTLGAGVSELAYRPLINIQHNPIRCDCEFAIFLTQPIRDGGEGATLRCGDNDSGCLTCSNSSVGADHDWSNKTKWTSFRDELCSSSPRNQFNSNTLALMLLIFIFLHSSIVVSG